MLPAKTFIKITPNYLTHSSKRRKLEARDSTCEPSTQHTALLEVIDVNHFSTTARGSIIQHYTVGGITECMD